MHSGSWHLDSSFYFWHSGSCHLDWGFYFGHSGSCHLDSSFYCGNSGSCHLDWRFYYGHSGSWHLDWSFYCGHSGSCHLNWIHFRYLTVAIMNWFVAISISSLMQCLFIITWSLSCSFISNQDIYWTLNSSLNNTVDITCGPKTIYSSRLYSRFLNRSNFLTFSFLVNKSWLWSIFFFLETDDCTPIPCLNNGTCTNLFNDYNCTCEHGYFGYNCENGTYVHILHRHNLGSNISV